MKYAALDANVLGPGLMFKQGVSAEVVIAWIGNRFELILSENLFGELNATLNKPYWRSRFSQLAIDQAIALAAKESTFVDPTPGVENVATHWQDDVVIATALAGNAEYLVTDDKELLRLKSYKTVSIVSPQEFLELLEAENEANPDD
ncbi:MAG: putative toxin-antitoxin system toxin component, PIN family [Thermomicrobiales bacterium]